MRTKKCKKCGAIGTWFEKGSGICSPCLLKDMPIRRTLLSMIDDLRSKGYESEAIVSAIENHLKFNRYLNEGDQKEKENENNYDTGW